MQAWRERDAHGTDAVRRYFIEALARRAAGQTGQARALLDRRLAQLLRLDERRVVLEGGGAEIRGEMRRDAHGEAGSGQTGDGQTGDGQTGDGQTGDDQTGDDQTDDGQAGGIQRGDVDCEVREEARGGLRGGMSVAAAPASDSLAALLDYIEQRPAGDFSGLADQDLTRLRITYPELSVIEYFRKAWSRFNTHRQLRQSLEQVPKNAGPLNSSSLVHRSLALMGELSPGYLQHFLSHLDALSWMEQMKGGGADMGKDGQRAAGARKGGRSK